MIRKEIKLMKTTRKILALLMALTLCLSLTTVAFAQEGEQDGDEPGAPADDTSSGYVITIDNAVQGETYRAYKIFDVKVANENDAAATPAPATDIPGSPDPNHQYTAYAYTILDTSPWWSVVTSTWSDNTATSNVPASVTLGTNFTANGLKYTKTANANEWIVEEAAGFSAATFAALLRDHMPNNAVAAATATATTVTDPTTHSTDEYIYTTGKVTLDVGSYGYYFVDTTTGSLCSLDTTEPTATIREKNSLPTQIKEVKTGETTITIPGVNNEGEGGSSESHTYTSENWGESTTANIGDTVKFKIEIMDGIGTDKELTLHDVMSAGLTLDPTSFTIQANTHYNEQTEVYELETVAASNYTIKTRDIADSYDNPGDADCTFEIVFNADYIASLDEDSVITIKYSARVNEGAVIAEHGNPNTSHVTYSNQHTPTSTADVYTYAGAIYKFDGATGSELAGATFEVTDSTGASVKLVEDHPGSATTPAIYIQVTDATEGNYVTSIRTPDSGAVVLLGFAEGTVLTLTETVAPLGYNLAAQPFTLTINETSDDTLNKPYTNTNNVTVTFYGSGDKNEDTVNVDDAGEQIHANSIEFIENNTGSELPSTGGIGTRIFLIAGSILVLGAGIFLVAMSVSKRRSEEN